jgi:hypothetical protein
MKPVRAPASIHRALSASLGLGFSHGYYQGLARGGPLSLGVHFARHPSGVLVYLSSYYPIDASGIRINPEELCVLYPDGTLGGTPDASEVNRFWNFSDSRELVSRLSSLIESSFAKLSAPELMVEVYKFLLGEGEKVPPEFSVLASDWLRRRPTQNRLLALACYLACAGDFEGAQVVISSMRPDFVGPAELKVLTDCAKGRIEHSAERVEYLKAIGAKA